MNLRSGALKDLVDKIVEIDSYKSKMGDDKDIVTLAFSVRTKEPAQDLMKFLESGYTFILDSDATPGEQSDGYYRVFVELERNKQVIENIIEVIYGVKELTELDVMKFRYYKNFRSRPIDEQSLTELLPTDPESYASRLSEVHMENYKNFFNKSFLESVDMYDDNLVIRKAFAEPLSFDVVDIVNDDETVNVVTESFNIDAYPELLYLTKYVGDYNISKYGEKLVFENEGKALILKRI